MLYGSRTISIYQLPPMQALVTDHISYFVVCALLMLSRHTSGCTLYTTAMIYRFLVSFVPIS
jgi:hypothetical protein